MQKYLCALLFICCSVNLLGQSYLLRKYQTELAFTVVQQPDQKLGIRIDKNNLNGLLFDPRLSLTDGDLLFQFRAKELIDQLSYELKFELLNPEQNLLRTTIQRVTEQQTQGLLLESWKDVTESDLIYDRTYLLQITNNLWGPDSTFCDSRPEFGFNRQWPHLAVGLAGLGLVAIGQSLRSSAKDLYDQVYLAAYTQGSSQEIGSGIYANFDDEAAKHRDYTWVGIGVLAIDGIWYLARLKKFHKDKRKFDKYCNAEPTLSLGFHSVLPNQVPGLAVHYNRRF